MRNFRDWVEACANVTPGKYVPQAFRKWTALATVGAALRRQVWYPHGDWDARPNLFIALVAPPTHGKGVSFTAPFDLIYKNLTEPTAGDKKDKEEAQLEWKKYIRNGDWDTPLRLIGGKVTYEELCVVMKDIIRNVEGTSRGRFPCSSILVKTSEFGVFMNRTATNLQMLLTEAWDSAPDHEYRTKTAGSFIVKGPTITWCAAATPSQFVEHMPANAKDQGLLSRIIPVVKMDAPPTMEVRVDSFDMPTIEKLREDLGQIMEIKGPFWWSKECEEDLVKPWLEGGLKPLPTDAMMQEYNGRRFSHLIKMSMCFSAARRDSRVMTSEDWIDAQALLFAAEENMPLLFRRFSMSDAGKLADDLVEMVRRTGRMYHKTLQRTAIRTSRTCQDVDAIIATLIESGALIKQDDFILLGTGL